MQRQRRDLSRFRLLFYQNSHYTRSFLEVLIFTTIMKKNKQS